MRLLSVLCALLLSVAQANVIDFTDKTLNTAIASGKPLFVEFFAPWCGACKQLAPQWKKLGKSVSDKVIIGRVNCPDNEDLCREHKIWQYPMLFLWQHGKAPVEFDGLRMEREMTEWLEEQGALLPPPDQRVPEIQITLRSFPDRSVDSVRLLLELLGKKYHMLNVNPHDWPTFRAQGVSEGWLPHGQLPLLSYVGEHLPGLEEPQDDVTGVTQILSFLGRKFHDEKLFGDSSAEYVVIDQLSESFATMYRAMLHYAYGTSASTARRNRFADVLRSGLEGIEYVAARLHSKPGHFLSHLTVLDVYAFPLLEAALGFDRDILKDFPTLSTFTHEFAKLPAALAFLRDSQHRAAHIYSSDVMYSIESELFAGSNATASFPELRDTSDFRFAQWGTERYPAHSTAHIWDAASSRHAVRGKRSDQLR